MTAATSFLITVSVFNDLPPVALVAKPFSAKFCEYSRRLMCFWIPCVFSELTFPTFVCWIISPRVKPRFWELFFWKISLCSPVDYFSLRISLAETKFMFEFFFPFAVVFVLNFGLYLKGVVRGFFPVGLKGVFYVVISKKLSLQAWSSPLQTLPGWCCLCLGCLLGSPVKPNSTASPS